MDPTMRSSFTSPKVISESSSSLSERNTEKIGCRRFPAACHRSEEGRFQPDEPVVEPVERRHLKGGRKGSK